MRDIILLSRKWLLAAICEKILKLITIDRGRLKNNCNFSNQICALERDDIFSIGNEYKSGMYQLMRDIMMITKIDKREILYYLNRIDANLNTQRIYLRIMKKNRWIDEKKFNVAMGKVYEIGKILGGLIKYYAKDSKKCL